MKNGIFFFFWRLMTWKSEPAAESQHKRSNWGLESPQCGSARRGSAKPRGAVTCSTFILEMNQSPGITEGHRGARKFLPNSFQCLSLGSDG